MDKWADTALAVITAIIGLAIVAVILSQQANTVNVINAAGGALAGVIGTAIGPVSPGNSGTISGTSTLGAP